MAYILRKLEVPYPSIEAAPTFLLNHDIKPIEKCRRVWGKCTLTRCTREALLTLTRLASICCPLVYYRLQYEQLSDRILSSCNWSYVGSSIWRCSHWTCFRGLACSRFQLPWLVLQHLFPSRHSNGLGYVKVPISSLQFLTIYRLLWIHFRGSEQNLIVHNMVWRPVLAGGSYDLRLSSCNVAIT